jgi:hypothetical protein
LRRESRRRCQIDKTVGEVETATDPIQELIDAVNSQEPVNGFTHKYYRYPARFSPLFPRAAIRAFTEPGDVVLDPFMGSGTTLVEALTQGRRAVGSDVNSLATFLATVKTSTLSENDLETVIEWADALPDHLNLHSPAARAIEWKEAGYQVHLPWRHRKTIEFILDRLQVLPRRRQQRLVACTSSLLIIPIARKPDKRALFHPSVRGARHDTTPHLLSIGHHYPALAVHHAAPPLAEPTS